jgi:hypothetical protein
MNGLWFPAGELGKPIVLESSRFLVLRVDGGGSAGQGDW